MKKIILITALASGFSTTTFSQPGFGIQVGGNLAFTRLESKSPDNGTTQKVNTDPRLGFLAGFVTEIPFGLISFRPEVNYVQKGFRYNNEGSFFGTSTTTDNKALLHYIEIPLNVTFNVPSSGDHLFFGVGPTVAWGIGGKYKATSSIGTVSSTETRNIKFDGDESPGDNDIHLKSFEFSGNVLAGYKMTNGFTINLGYTLGFSDILPGKNDNSWKNSGFAMKVGYMFGGNSNASKKTSSGSGM